MMKTILFTAAAIVGSTYGFSTQPSLSVETRQISTTNLSAQTNDNNDDTSSTSRRRHFLTTAVTTGSAILLPTLLSTNAAYASGGATAGKYTTIPIAKRRYYGRVQEAVHEFLLMGPAVIKDDLSDPIVQVSCFFVFITTLCNMRLYDCSYTILCRILLYDMSLLHTFSRNMSIFLFSQTKPIQSLNTSSIKDFFDVTKTVVVEGKKKDINGVCTKKDGDCKSTTIYDSRYNDMKTSMYLLGNAFRINQQKAPDNLPTVKAAKKFFKQMNIFERKVLGTSIKKEQKLSSASVYLEALDILDEYLDLVELPPTDSGNYDKEFSTLVGVSSRIT